MDQKDKVLGCLYGMGIGDAMGTPSSFKTPSYIKNKWGWIDTFIEPEKDHIYHAGLKAGEYTDDSEQSLALLDSYLANGKVVPEDVVKRILAWADRVKVKYASPLGPSTERALKAIMSGSCSINESGKYGNTNGSCMRIAPIGIIHGLLGSSKEELLKDVYATSFPTHNTTICISAAMAIAYGVSACISGEKDINKIVDGIKESSILGATKGFEFVGPSIAARIDVVMDIIAKNPDPKDAMARMWDLFGGGDLAGDSVPVTVGLFVLGKGDPKKTIEYAVNFGGDCDTNASMAGAMAGAYSGASAIPENLKATIEKVNHVDFEKYADGIMDIVKVWNK